MIPISHLHSWGFYHLNTALSRLDDKKEKTIVLEFFRKSVDCLMTGLTWGGLKFILKESRLPEEYLPMVQNRGKELLAELSIDDLEIKELRYTGASGCAVAVFLPMIKELLEEKRIAEVLEIVDLKQLLLMSVIPDTQEVRDYVCQLLEGLKLKELENLFQYTLNTNGYEFVRLDNIPKWARDTLYQQYSELIGDSKVGIRYHQDDLKWLWGHRLQCPFEEFFEVFDYPLRKALANTQANIAWDVCKSYSHAREPYLQLCRHKYVCWFTRRIPTETDIVQLNEWLTIGSDGSRTEKNVLDRVRRLWQALSFEELEKVQLPDRVNNRLGDLKSILLFEKLPIFLKAERSLEELFWAHNSIWTWNSQKVDWNTPVATAIASMSQEVLINWWNENKNNHFTEFSWESFNDRFCEFAQRDIDNQSLSPITLQKKADEIPINLSDARRILSNEAERRVLVENNINNVVEMLHQKCLLSHIARERFWQLLPSVLKASPEADIKKLWTMCPEGMRGEFVEIAQQIADGTWVEPVIEDDDGLTRSDHNECPF